MAFDTRLLSGIGVFAAVVESGGFARAGVSLGISGSGVSRAIARLEERVGVRLIDRSPRAVSLTAEGRIFLARLAPLLEEAESAVFAANGGKAEIKGNIRLSCDAPSARLIVAPMLSDLLSAHPALSIELVVREKLGDLVSEGFDAAVRFEDVDRVGHSSQSLGLTNIVTAASPALLESIGRTSHPRCLETLPCIVLRDPDNLDAYSWDFRKGDEIFQFRPRASVIVNDGTTMLAACIAGVGVAQLLAVEAAQAVRDGKLEVLFSDWSDEKYSCQLYLPSHRFQSPRLSAFVTHLRSHCLETLA